MFEFTLVCLAVIAVIVWALCGNDSPYKLPKE